MATLWRYHAERKLAAPSYEAADPTKNDIETKIEEQAAEVELLEAAIKVEKKKQKSAETV